MRKLNLEYKMTFDLIIFYFCFQRKQKLRRKYVCLILFSTSLTFSKKVKKKKHDDTLKYFLLDTFFKS